MLSVAQARRILLEGVVPLESERAPLSALAGRRLAETVIARLTQPPFPASAMDGYAVRYADAHLNARLRIIGEAPAGTPFDGVVTDGEAVRIFTGGVVPSGADHIVIQEDATRTDDEIVITARQSGPKHVRHAGIDFREGDRLAERGDVLHEMHGGLFAAANIPHAMVCRKPVVAMFANGDELREPGASLSPGEIINSNRYALSALIEAWGGTSQYLGCAPDDPHAVERKFEEGCEADVIVPIGGASVGDHDYVKSAFEAAGGVIEFSKVAVRPGKPTWCGRLGAARVVGLPGNPASAIVTAALFLQPLIRAMLGDPMEAEAFQRAILDAPLPKNGARESYLRAVWRMDDRGGAIKPAPNQDSALLSPFASANALIRRRAEEGPASHGDSVEFIRLR